MIGEINMELQKEIESYIDTVEATFGVYIKNLQTQEEVNINSDRLFQMASVFKVPILATLYDLIHKGEIDEHQRVKILEKDLVPGSGVIQEMEPGVELTIKDLATLMIIVSDNLATDKLLHMIGAKNVEQNMRDIGINDIHIEHSCWDLLRLSAGVPEQPYSKEAFNNIIQRLIMGDYDWDSIVFKEDTRNNVSTPKGMCLLLEKIAKNEFVSEACSEDIRHIMFKQQYKQRIGGLLPRGTKVASKTGSLGTMFNDAGIIYLPDDQGCFVMTVYSIGDSLDYQGNEPIAKIARMVFEHFVK